MGKSKDNLIKAKIILLLSIIILIFIVLYFKLVLNKQIYATNDTINNKKQLVKISEADLIDIEKTIENNNQNINKEEIYEKQEELEYITKYKYNNDLYVGTTRISQQGRNGIQTITIKKKLDDNGNIIQEEQVGARVTKSSLDKIIEIGTKVYVAPKVEKKYKSSKLSFNMALNEPSGLTIEQFKKILTDNKDVNKIFENNSDYFYYIEDEYGINGIFVASIGIHESAWGTSRIAKNKFNLFGYGAYDSNPYNGAYTFSNYSESIDLLARVLVKYYLNPKGTIIYDGQVASGKYYNGSTLSDVNKKYATDKNWANCVFKYMEYLYNKI